MTLSLFGHIDDLLLDQVALLSLRLADVDGLIGQLDVQRVGIGVGEDGHTFDAKAIGSSYDTACNFTSIRNKNLAQCHLFHRFDQFLAILSPSKIARAWKFLKEDSILRKAIVVFLCTRYITP